VPAFAQLAADLDTPPSASLRLRPGAHSFLLECANLRAVPAPAAVGS